MSPWHWGSHCFRVTGLAWPTWFRCLQFELTGDRDSSSQLVAPTAAEVLVLRLGLY